MGNRLINIQRATRELGRIRTGYTDKGKPVRSKTWIITTKDRDCAAVAAELWGGSVEKWTPLNGRDAEWRVITDTDSLDGFLPPGDPLNQNNEMWSRGGVTRRCNGDVESRSGKPCLCLAEYGADWFKERPEKVCRPYSQLTVSLLQLPDYGGWRLVTKSYYAAAEIAGMVDLIKAQVGPDIMIPVRLRIDQRKKVADGRTTPYPVPVISIRGASAAQVLAGDVPALAITDGGEPTLVSARAAIGGASRPALSAGPAVEDEPRLTAKDVLGQAGMARSVAQVQALWKDAKAAGVLTDAVNAALTARADELKAEATEVAPADAPAEAPADVDEVVDAEIVDEDPRELLGQINSAAGKAGMNTAAVERLIAEMFGGAELVDLTAGQMRQVAAEIKAGRVAA